MNINQSNRYENEHWAIPADPRLSFLGDKHHHHNLHQQQHQNQSAVHHAAPKLFFVTFPSVYNVLSFLEAKDIFTSFYPTCQGFAQIVQSLTASWWHDRLFDILFPSTPSDSFSNSTMSCGDGQKPVGSCISFHESQQQNLRINALHYLRRMIHDHHQRHHLIVAPLPLKQRIAQMCHYYQQKFPGCPTCHFPGENNFVAKNFRMQIVTGDELKIRFVEPWCAKQAVVEAFFLRGDSASETQHDSNILEGLAFPFSWRYLTADVSHHHLHEKQNCTANNDNFSSDTPRFFRSCVSCNRQYQIHASDYENVDPVELILGPIRLLQQQNTAANQNQNDSSNNDDEHEGNQKTGYPPLQPHAKLRSELSNNILLEQCQKLLPSIVTMGHEAEYWALLRGSAPTKVMTYLLRGERKHSVLSRLTNPISLKSVELRSFFGYRSDSFPRFFCQITFYAEGMILPSKNSKRAGVNQAEEVATVIPKSATDESSSSSSDDDDDDSSAAPSTSSSSSSSSDDDEIETEEKTTVHKETSKPAELEINSLQTNSNHQPPSTSTATVPSKKKNRKKKHHEILLTGSYATPKKKLNVGVAAAVSNGNGTNNNSQDATRDVDPYPPIKDRMEAAFNSDSELVQELFFAGYGRVEVEKVPSIQAKQLQRVAEYLELSPGFPLPLLWNAIILSTGFVVDYLIYAEDMRMTHRVALENMFEEALID